MKLNFNSFHYSSKNINILEWQLKLYTIITSKNPFIAIKLEFQLNFNYENQQLTLLYGESTVQSNQCDGRG